MYEANCWPALQMAAAQVSPITDCASLGPHIVQLSEDQADAQNPAILKLYGVKSLTAEACSEMLADIMTAPEVSEACASVGPYTLGLNTVPYKASNKAIVCLAEARYTRGQGNIHFYLDRDPDGAEFIGYVGLVSQLW